MPQAPSFLPSPALTTPELWPVQASNTPHKLQYQVSHWLQTAVASNLSPVILCIGTDRSTGDALGPLTGSKLRQLYPYPHIWGTLEQPVHATNLEETLAGIHACLCRPYIIAVDACLGRAEHIGCLTCAEGPLQPGAALKKSLPSVGDVHISGIVNIGGFLEHLVLQSTRLQLVMAMADTLARALSVSLAKQYRVNAP